MSNNVFESYFFYFIGNNFPDKLDKSDRIRNRYTYRINYSDLYKVAKRELGADNPIFKEISNESKNKTYNITFDNTGVEIDDPDGDINLIIAEVKKVYKNREKTGQIILYTGIGLLGLLTVGGIINFLYNDNEKDA